MAQTKTTSQMLREKWENATFADSFLFCKILSNDPELCKEIIELLLHIEIDHLETPESEKTAKTDYNAHGVRFDVYTKGDGKIFDVELQSINEDDLPKRAHYYQGVIDIENLPEGVLYKELKDSYVIFICLFGLFKKGLPVYTFENICREDGKTKLGDRALKHFFIAKNCVKMLKDKEIKEFFEFLISNKSSGAFTSNLKDYVEDARHNTQWRFQYMTWERQQAYAKEEGIEEGKIESARNLIRMSLGTPEQISQAVSLPLNEILALKEEIEAETIVSAN